MQIHLIIGLFLNPLRYKTNQLLNTGLENVVVEEGGPISGNRDLQTLQATENSKNTGKEVSLFTKHKSHLEGSIIPWFTRFSPVNSGPFG